MRLSLRLASCPGDQRASVSQSYLVLEELKRLSFSWMQLGYLPQILMFPGGAYIQTCWRNYSHFDLSHIDQRGCPRSSFIAQPALCLLPPPHCSWGSRSLATASLVARAPYRQRTPASPSGTRLSLQAQPLPTIPPQVLLLFFVLLTFSPLILCWFSICVCKYGPFTWPSWICACLWLENCSVCMSQCLTWQTLKRRPPCVWWMS